MKTNTERIYSPRHIYKSVDVFKSKLKHNARKKLKYALKVGKIVKLPCDVCGEERVEAHHPDYTLPLEVLWLCREHHMMLHKCLKREKFLMEF